MRAADRQVRGGLIAAWLGTHCSMILTPRNGPNNATSLQATLCSVMICFQTDQAPVRGLFAMLPEKRDIVGDKPF